MERIFLAGSKKNPIFLNLKNVLHEYWKTHDFLIDYFLVDYCLMLSYSKFENLKKLFDTVPVNNINIHKLQPILLKHYNNILWDNLNKNTKLYKLSYKLDFDEREKDSFYDKIMQGELK